MTSLFILLLALLVSAPSYAQDAGVILQQDTTSLGRTRVLNCTGGGITCSIDSGIGSLNVLSGGATSGLGDPGANGIVKRTGPNTTAPAVAGTDYVAPGGAFTGNAATASAFDHDPAACAANTFAVDQNAAGALVCSQPTATQILNTPAGGIAATTVQTALNELDTEKASAATLTTHTADTAAHSATAANTASRIVTRDASGNFAAGTITATLTGNAATATAFDHDPAACAANTFAVDQNAAGALVCNQPTATQIVNTPAGSLSATTAQGALAELDAEKQPLDADLTTLATKTVAGTGSDIRMSTGAFGIDDCVKVDSNGNFATSGADCGTGGGGGSSGVSSFNTRTGAVTAATDDYTAAQVTNTPMGNISSVQVQGALNELENEKAPLTTLNAHIAETAPHEATANNTPLRIVSRDGSGNFTAGTITANLTGTATMASALAFDVATQAEMDAHTALTTAHGATATNTASRLVMRDASGDFAAGTITANLTGTASAASALTFDVATQTELDVHAALTTAHGATTAPTANRIPMSGSGSVLDGGWLPFPSSAVKGGVLTGGNCNATTGKMVGMGTDGLPVCGTDQNSGTGGPGSQGLQDVVAIQRRVTDAVDLDSCVAFGGLTHYICIYGNATEGAKIVFTPGFDMTWTLAAGKDWFLNAADGSHIVSVDNDTETFSLLNPLAITSGGTGQATAQLAINALTGVAAATNEQCLMKDTVSGNAIYKTCSTEGNVEGPGTSTDNAAAVYDGTTGALLKNSLVIIDPITGNITTPGTVSAGAGGSGGGGWVFTEGTAPTAPAVNTIQVYAPVDVTTAYGIALPAASATGFLLGTNASNVNTLSFVPFTGTGNVMRATAPTFASYADVTEATAPATPSAGVQRFYAKTGGALCGKNSAGTETCMGSGGGGTPGGSTTQVQYNNAGAFGGITGATTNGTVLTTTNQVLVTAALGTPQSGTLTNATGLPPAGVVGTAATLAGAESLTNKKLGSLTSNGLVQTSGGDGTLSVTVPGTGVTTFLTTPNLANFNTALSDADVATLTGAESLTNKKLGSLTTNGYVKTTGGDGTLSVVAAPTLTVTRPMKMSTISVSNANAFVDTIDGTNFDYSGVRFVDTVTGDTFWTYKIPPELAATPAWNVIVTSKAITGAGGNVVLNLSCKDFATNVAFDAALTPLQAATSHAINTSANTTITTLSGTNYDGTVPLTAGDLLVCQLSRVGGSGSDQLVDWLVLDVSIRHAVNIGT